MPFVEGCRFKSGYIGVDLYNKRWVRLFAVINVMLVLRDHLTPEGLDLEHGRQDRGLGRIANADWECLQRCVF